MVNKRGANSDRGRSKGPTCCPSPVLDREVKSLVRLVEIEDLGVEPTSKMKQYCGKDSKSHDQEEPFQTGLGCGPK